MESLTSQWYDKKRHFHSLIILRDSANDFLLQLMSIPVSSGQPGIGTWKDEFHPAGLPVAESSPCDFWARKCQKNQQQTKTIDNAPPLTENQILAPIQIADQNLHYGDAIKVNLVKKSKSKKVSHSWLMPVRCYMYSIGHGAGFSPRSLCTLLLLHAAARSNAAVSIECWHSVAFVFAAVASSSSSAAFDRRHPPPRDSCCWPVYFVGDAIDRCLILSFYAF